MENGDKGSKTVVNYVKIEIKYAKWRKRMENGDKGIKMHVLWW